MSNEYEFDNYNQPELFANANLVKVVTLEELPDLLIDYTDYLEQLFEVDLKSMNLHLQNNTAITVEDYLNKETHKTTKPE